MFLFSIRYSLKGTAKREKTLELFLYFPSQHTTIFETDFANVRCVRSLSEASRTPKVSFEAKICLCLGCSGA
jgi:hypothetical protein